MGAVISSATPELVEIAAVTGFDFVTFDAEHETLDDAALTHCIRAAEAFGITPIMRIAKDPDRALRLMDQGAQGVHVPRCTTPDDMRDLVSWTRFHPGGQRTFYRLGRGGNYNQGLDDAEWSRRTDEATLVIAMIEEAAALDHLDPMLAVSGIDAIHIGPKDLWQSLGMPPADVVDAAIGRIAEAVLRAGKHLSLQLRAGEAMERQLARCEALGARMVSVPLLGLLAQRCQGFVADVRRRSRS
ncbi:HpcH/HpaI aldolase family protein [Rhodopila sp.]|uniref:HpcH/HpaI aldolase family protein n=1 Tax=Rhodopila sp. TaxID=2480087 RepID=UPI002D7E36B9|nr:aldolase/citrate lyase family protein [Rhodopila sp.]